MCAVWLKLVFMWVWAGGIDIWILHPPDFKTGFPPSYTGMPLFWVLHLSFVCGNLTIDVWYMVCLVIIFLKIKGDLPNSIGIEKKNHSFCQNECYWILKLVKFLNGLSADLIPWIFTEQLVCARASAGVDHIKMNNSGLFPALKEPIVESKPVNENPNWTANGVCVCLCV